MAKKYRLLILLALVAALTFTGCDQTFKNTAAFNEYLSHLQLEGLELEKAEQLLSQTGLHCAQMIPPESKGNYKFDRRCERQTSGLVCAQRQMIMLSIEKPSDRIVHYSAQIQNVCL